jgi:thiol-disulfide isomerase/thioredoxin
MKCSRLAAMMIAAILSVCAAQETVSPAANKILAQAHDFAARGKPERALQCLEEALPRYPGKTFDRYAILSLKFDLLSGLSRNGDALAVCIEKANIVTSPRQALIVAGACLRVNDRESALNWLQISVDRGLLSYAVFDDPLYDPLRSDGRFASLAQAIRRKNGIGLPAKPFTARTIEGAEIALGQFTGKVLLLDFWATWCPPCVKQMPGVKKLHDEFPEARFAVVGVAAETDIGNLREFLQRIAIAWPTVANDQGGYDQLAELYGVKNIPASFLIDKKGLLREVNLPEEKLRQAITDLIKE